MQKSVSIILLIIFNLTFGQEKDDPTESLISEFKAEMKKESVSDFFIVKHITYGYHFLIYKKGDTTSCKTKGYYFTMYAFWKNNDETWIKKFDNCGAFNSIKLVGSNPIGFYKDNGDKIKKEEVEIYTVRPDNITKDKEYSYVSTRSHSPQRYFWFYQNSTEFKKKFDKYNLETEKGNENHNYESNNNLAIAKLNTICEGIIDSLNKKGLFNQQK
ncbi:hypothetical protein [Aquimarina macrocephali]|uniref:hypothetical protein n=1 Tax=Aquimarina macrocephali TaxID=666563 RepID=UPI003F67A873